MKYWYRLNIDTVDAIKKDFKFVAPNKPLGVWHYPAVDIFNASWLQYIKNKGISVKSAMVFYRAPYANAPTAHIDLARPSATSDQISVSNFGLNWVIGGAGSKMVWYDDTSLDKSVVKFTESSNPFMDWPLQELIEIGSALTLVNVNTPHTVLMKDEPRWCISARTNIKDNISWEDIIKYMQSKNLLIEK
jgi:hypothetical protein